MRLRVSIIRTTLAAFVLLFLTVLFAGYAATGAGSLPDNSAPQVGPLASPTPTVLVLSQGVNGYAGTTDTWLNSFATSTNYGGADRFQVRGGGQASALVRFDLSPVPSGVTILSARLQLHTIARSSAGSINVGAFGMRRPWIESEATWLHAAAGQPWAGPGASDPDVDRLPAPASVSPVSALGADYSWDVTGLVQGWYATPASNFGAILVGVDSTLIAYDFQSSFGGAFQERPKLIIEYVQTSLETVTPTPSATITPTATPGPSPTPTPVPTISVVFSQGRDSYGGTTDTWLNSFNQAANYGGATLLEVRGGGQSKSVVRFDLSPLPTGIVIQRARLRVYSLSRSNTSVVEVGAFRLLRPWLENEATWQQARIGEPWFSPGASGAGVDRTHDPDAVSPVAAINTWTDWDITGYVQLWYTLPAENFGVLLEGISPTLVQYNFQSSFGGDWQQRPQLVIDYSAGPIATATPTATPTRTRTPTATPSRTPTATATATPIPTISVILSQGWDDYTGTRNTWINSLEPAVNKSGEALLEVGADGQSSALISFDLSPLPADITIRRARLRLYSQIRSQTLPIEIGAFR